MLVSGTLDEAIFSGVSPGSKQGMVVRRVAWRIWLRTLSSPKRVPCPRTPRDLQGQHVLTCRQRSRGHPGMGGAGCGQDASECGDRQGARWNPRIGKIVGKAIFSGVSPGSKQGMVGGVARIVSASFRFPAVPSAGSVLFPERHRAACCGASHLPALQSRSRPGTKRRPRR